MTWLVCFALSQGLALFTNTGLRWWLAAAVLLVWCCLLALAERVGRFWAVLALWVIAVAVCLLVFDRGLLLGTAREILARRGTDGSYGEIVLLMASCTAALPVSQMLRSYGVRLALCVLWILLWIASAIFEWPMTRFIPAAMAPVVLFTVAETVSRVRGDPEPQGRLRRAILLTLIPALLLSVLPSPSEPYGYPLLHSVAEKVEDLLYDVNTALRFRHTGEKQFGISFNGIPDDAELANGAQMEPVAVIHAKADETTDGPLYIFGNAWNYFDGRSWGSTLKSGTADSLRWTLDTAEHMYALWRYLGEGNASGFSDYFRKNSVYLNCRDLDARTMFRAQDTTSFFTNTDRYPYGDSPTGILFRYVQTEEVWYRVYYLEPNSRTLDGLIRASEGKTYDKSLYAPLWKTLANDFENDFELDIWEGVNLEQTLAARAELIYDVYLDTSSVSDRARALAEEITAGCGSDYEKLTAIAAYLKENYAYTLRPKQVPEGENFLDWLLFEGREGYCTWYATAATLLARCAGVPARFVQGYRASLPGKTFKQLGPGDAHAWCEGYITGYGWVTVEATPGLEGQSAGWMTQEEKKEAGMEEPEHVQNPEGEPVPGGPDSEGKNPNPKPVPQGEAWGDIIVEPDQEEEASARRFPVWLAVLIPVALIAAAAALLLLRRSRRKRRYEEADPSEKLRLDLESLLRDLRGKGYPRNPEESLSQYFGRLPWRFLLGNAVEAKEMADLYDRTFFGKKAPSEEELERHRRFAGRFRPHTLKQRLLWYRLQL